MSERSESTSERQGHDQGHDQDTVQVIGMAGQPPRRISLARLENIEKANRERRGSQVQRSPDEGWHLTKWGDG